MKGARRDLAWGVLSQGLQYGSALLVLPLLVTRLPSAQVGLWFIFMAIQSLVTILDFGFAPTLSRNFAFVFAGVQELRAEGITGEKGDINFRLLATLLRASRLLYAAIALVVGLVLALPGSWYIYQLLHRNPELTNIWPAWLIFSISTSINIFFLQFSPLLIGSNLIRKEYQVWVINRGLFALLSIVFLLNHGQLVHISVAHLVGVLVSRVYAGFSCAQIISRTRGIKIKFNEKIDIINIISKNAFKSGLVSLGTFLISWFSVFIISYYYGLEQSAKYSISIQVYSIIHALSHVALTTMLPKISALRVQNDFDKIRKIYIKINIYIIAIFVLGTTTVLTLGNRLLQLIHAHTLMLNPVPLAILGLIWVLEANHAAAAAIIATGNRVPFLKGALFSGLAIAIGATLVAKLGLGVGAVILVQGLVQLSYNNWKWPTELYAELGIRWRDWTDLVRLGGTKPKTSSIPGGHS